MMKISVITICYNSESVIRKTIESVLGQTYPDIEYLIIDGASGDQTVNTAKEYLPRFMEKGYEYRIISEPDKGIYDAMNKGIRNATGDLVGIINSGDWYEPDACAVAADAYDQEHYDLFYADINLVRADGSVLVKHSRTDRFPTSRHWNHPSMFVTKDTYKDLGTYRCEGIHDDFEFLLRTRRAGKKVSIRNRVIANFATGGTSNDKTFQKCRKRCLDRYHAYRRNGYSPLSMIECVAIETAKFLIS